MVVIAGESGLRADEIRHLDIHRDLFYEKTVFKPDMEKGLKGQANELEKQS